MSYYQIDVQSANADPYVSDVKYAQAFGDLDTINYIAKKVVKEIEDVSGNLVLVLNEVDSIGGQSVREVVSVTANAKVVATVLKGELTSERKAAKSAPAETPESSGEIADLPGDDSNPYGVQTDVQLDTNDSRY